MRQVRVVMMPIEPSLPEPLATLDGTLTSDGTSVDFSLIEPVEVDRSLLLPDTQQVRSGHLEIMAKLTIAGEVHADETQELDVSTGEKIQATTDDARVAVVETSISADSAVA
jgi:hypothetical protein